ncbi:MAG TPA: copper amine oxidase N-terminal domain-containing protein, partial [Caldisericia bacterium]|nr:copper amine oxidase N-terminal domain-containing protein [Caldisericia bacterium]
INNMEIYIDPDNIKVVPFIIPPGRTVVPIRFISETFGAKVDWEGDTKTVRIYLESKNIRITLQVDNKIARLNDKVVTLDAAPLIKEGRTFVPLRFISEAFGAKVDWFSSEKKIVIEYNP